MPTPDEMRAAVETYVEASNRDDKAAVLELFAEDTEWFDPVGQPAHAGRAGVSEFWDQTRTMADKIEMKLKDVITCGDEAVMVFEIHATIGGGTMIMDGVETFEFDAAGRFARVKAYWDMSRARTNG
jgi:steroid Delta-isomerase